MTKRTTKRDLESLCKMINERTNSPLEPYTQDPETRKVAPQVGCHYLAGAYGGWRLERISKGGGSSDVLGSGYCSARELADQMRAYLAGMGVAQ